MRDAEIGVFVLIIFVFSNHYRGIIAQTVAAHQCKVVLKRAATHWITSPFKFRQRIGTGVNQVVDSPAAIMVLETLVNGGNSYESGAIDRHNQIFFYKSSKFLSSAQIHCARTSQLCGMNINGKTTSAEIFTDNIELSALDWITELCDHPAMESVPIVQMPDVHAGSSCNVGTAYPIGMYVNPDHVGVDIGCTISMHRLSFAINPNDFPLLDHRIREVIPTGADICQKNSLNEKELFRFLNSQYQKARSATPDLINEAPRIDGRFITDFCRRIKLQEGIFYKSLGTLGGGNHFIEYGEDSELGDGWLTIHCGSRNLGVKVANHWRNIAQNPKRAKYIGYLWGDALRGYLSDMIIAQAYALFNHQIIRDRIFAILKKLCKAKCVESIFTTHNYISVTDDVPMLRKGAIDASEGRKVAIPFNMRDGIAICIGKGNEQWLNTAPHGAGRIMSRAQAKKQISLNEFENSMTGIYSSSVCPGTLDESPMAYKPTGEILELIRPTVEVIAMIKPKLNIKDNGE